MFAQNAAILQLAVPGLKGVWRKLDANPKRVAQALTVLWNPFRVRGLFGDPKPRVRYTTLGYVVKRLRR